eukprot:COSAG04_NODE_294_length_17734_cov_15.211568_14_plen_275_part_00
MCADKAPDANGKNGSHKSFSTCPLYEKLPEFIRYHELCATANRELRSLLGKLCLSINVPCIAMSMSNYAESTEVAALQQIRGINFGAGSYVSALCDGAAPSAIPGIMAEIVSKHFASGDPMVRFGVGDRRAGAGKGHTGTQRFLYFGKSLAQLAHSVVEKPDAVRKACAAFTGSMKEEQQKLATVRASAPFAQSSPSLPSRAQRSCRTQACSWKIYETLTTVLDPSEVDRVQLVKKDYRIGRFQLKAEREAAAEAAEEPAPKGKKRKRDEEVPE